MSGVRLPKYEPLAERYVRDPDQKRSLWTRIAGFIAIVATAAVLLSYRPLELSSSSNLNLDAVGGASKSKCPSGLPLPAKPPAPVNLWASLTVSEIVAVQSWLEAPERALNLTRSDVANISDNFIYLIEAYRPAKAAALSFLSDPAHIRAPDRYARVTIHHGGLAEPVIKDYLVGPLTISDSTTIVELKDIYHRDYIPFNARGYAFTHEFNDVLSLIMQSSPGLAEAMQDLFGGVAMGYTNDTLVAGGSAPFGIDGSFRRLWITWRRNTAGVWLHPVGFFQYIDISGTDTSKWKVLKVVYNHQLFPSVSSFLEAYHNKTLERLPDRPDQDPSESLSWSSRKRIGPQRDLDDLPGPRSVSFAGLRFRVDVARQYVSWMGWGMFLGFDRDMGLSLWDVRFRNERILYELAPQEALAQYAGNDPIQTSTAWLDRFFGMGQMVRDMLPGYDCPHEAIYLPASTYSSLGISTRKRAICVFESDTGRPLTRHAGYINGEFGAVRGYTLTVRSTTTVGNYDYLFDYIFHLDGTIEVRLSASGYLQAGFWEPKQKGYGTQIRDTTMGTVHDHVINYKVDLDIAGTANSLLHTSTAQEEVTQPWFDEDWGQTVIQQKITREYIENEDDARLKFPTNFQGGYAIVNQEKTNAWDTPRGYAIHPGYSPIHNTIVGSKRLLNNANWARYNLAVSRRKDKEPTSSSMWNLHLPGEPMVDFHKFFDGENITQEDLVAWVNVGMHHLPQAEDAPNTRTNTATSSFFLTPFNYFDSDVSIDSTNAILLDIPDDLSGPFTYNDYGVKPANCIPEPPAAFEYAEPQWFEFHNKPAPLH